MNTETVIDSTAPLRTREQIAAARQAVRESATLNDFEKFRHLAALDREEGELPPEPPAPLAPETIAKLKGIGADLEKRRDELASFEAKAENYRRRLTDVQQTVRTLGATIDPDDDQALSHFQIESTRAAILISWIGSEPDRRAALHSGILAELSRLDSVLNKTFGGDRIQARSFANAGHRLEARIELALGAISRALETAEDEPGLKHTPPYIRAV